MPRFSRHPPVLREIQNLRNEGVLKLLFQAAVIGGGSGVVIGLFRIVYDASNAHIVTFLKEETFSTEWSVPFIFGILILLGAIVGRLVRWEPLISGSGIPQVELALAGQSPFPWLRIVVSKFIGTLLSLSGGLSVGREGPSIQMGAAVGCGFGQLWKSTSQNAPRFLIAGSVAGLTAAFGAPVAGMLFAFEEIKTLITVPLLLFTSAAAGTAWLVVHFLFGFGRIFPFSATAPLSLDQFWLCIPMGLFCGLFSALYNKMLIQTTLFHDRQTLIPQTIKPILPFLLAGLLLYIYPQVLVGIGLSTADLAEMGTLEKPFLGSLLLLLWVKIFFSIFSFASGVPGGLLMPMLAIGSMTGAVLGTLALEGAFIDATHFPTFLVLGMTGLFAGTVRAPLTGVALVAEMSGAFLCLPGMILVALLSTFAANKIGSPPVYDSLKKRILQLHAREKPIP